MKLELERESIENPDPAAIERALSRLDGDYNTYAVLEKDEMTYIQTAGKPDEGYVLEYQEASTDAHYQSVRSDLSIFDVQRAFVDYAAGGSTWKNSIEWKPFDIRSKRPQAGTIGLIFIAALIVAAFTYFKLIHPLD